jgi:hypothetical protein
LLLQKAYFYVCGDAANMAREVNTMLAQIIAEQRGIPESKAEEVVKSMRSANQYQVCNFLPFLPFCNAIFDLVVQESKRNRAVCCFRNAFRIAALLRLHVQSTRDVHVTYRHV